MWGNITIYNPKIVFEKEYKNYKARIYNYKTAYYAEIIVNDKVYRD